MWKTGMLVKIKRESEFYHQAPDLIGTIISQPREGTCWVTVKFIKPNGNIYTNDYRINNTDHTRNDLIPVPNPNLKITIRRKI